MQFFLPSLVLGAALSLHAFAGQPVAPEECCELNLWTGEGVSLGGWLFPEINYQVAAGSSTTNPAKLAVGHHDPDRYGITQQAFEVSLTAKLGRHVSLFGTYSGKVDINDHWLSEFEEYYAILHDLPGDLRIRGGRFATRFGYQNEKHIHSYTFIDQYLASGRMFGEDPLVIYGGEVGLPVLRTLPAGWDDRLTVSFGSVPEQEEEEHAHEGPEAEFEGENALLADWAATADYTLGYNVTSNVRWEFGASGAFGRNGFGRSTQVYGLHFDWLWRPEGVLRVPERNETAEFLRWRTELFLRRFGAVAGHEEETGHEDDEVHHEEEAEHDDEASSREDFTDFGVYTTLSYGFPGGKTQAHLRGEYVSGVAEAGLPERWRVSPGFTWFPSDRVPFHFKLQYNYDHSPSFGDEHSVWAQFSLTWGDCCAHEH